MADRTITYAIDNAGPNPDGSYNVVVQNICRRITLRENYNSSTPPTVNLIQKMPAGAANAANITEGDSAIYTALASQDGGVFRPTQIAGTIKTAGGAASVQQIESDQI